MPFNGALDKYFDDVVNDLYSRFEEKFTMDCNTGCWNWTGTQDGKGYGRFSMFGSPRPAYRIAYELYCEKIPDGLVLDHLCRNPACVNPAHLEPVTLAENTRRGHGALMSRNRNLAKTHCKKGHELVFLSNQRGCRVCINERRSLHRAQIGTKKKDTSGLMLGAKASAVARKSRSVCKNGHDWTIENTLMTPTGRSCRSCHREREAQRRAHLRLVA